MKTKLFYLLLLVISSIHSQVPTLNLVGRYDLSQGSLNDAIASVPLTKSGEASTTISDRFGNDNEAIFLNGDDLTRPDIDFDVSNSNPFLPKTISFWLKTTTNDGNVRIIYNDNDQTSVGDTNFSGVTVFLQNGKINASNRAGLNGNLLTHSTIITDNKWHHVVIQAYSEASTSRITNFFRFIYVDGVKMGGTGYIANLSNNIVRANKHFGNVSFFRLKATSLPVNNKYQDGIDELLFYTRLLTDSEVNLIMTSNQINTLSIDKLGVNKHPIKVYPNPATNILNIDIPTTLKQAIIYSVLGRKILKTQSDIINIAHLNNGLYLIKIEDKAGVITTKRFIKK